MEENFKNKINTNQEIEDDFKDFDESDTPLSLEDIEMAEANLQEQLKALAQGSEETSMFQQTKSSEIKKEEEIAPENCKQISEANIEQQKQEEENNIQSPWENYKNEEDSAVKKYIFYISKDFVPYIDNLTTDERTAYINDAIQKKIDIENQEHQNKKKRKVVFHLIVMILTFIIMTPIVLLGAHKAIMVTFENYKYSQENFEKLYKSRFEKDRAYMRSVQYNKEQEQKKKNK